MKLYFDSRAVAGLALLGLVFYLPLRAAVELEAATGGLPLDFITKQFTLIQLLTPVMFMLLVFLIVGRWAAPETDNQYRAFVVVLAAFFIIVVLYVALFDRATYDSNARSVTAFNVGVVLSHVFALSVGAFLWRALAYGVVVLVCWLLLVLQVLSSIDFASFSLSISAIDPDRIAVYLLYGDTFAVWSLLAVAVLRSDIARLSVYLGSLIIAFTLYSRTSFYALAFVFPIIMLRLGKPARVGAIAVFSGVVIAFLLLYGESLFQHRMFRFLLEGSDASLSLRDLQAAAGYKAIFENWIGGDYAGQVRDFGVIGSYIHNILSYWRQFGLFAFVCLLYMIFACFSFWWKMLRFPVHESKELDFFIFLFPLILVESLFSRSYNFPYLWLLLGVYLGVPNEWKRRVRYGL